MEPVQGILQLERQFKSVFLRLPVIIGNAAVNFTLDNFRRQGFLGSVFSKWAERKAGWSKDKRPGRNILIGTGRLRRSIRITYVTADSVAIGTDVPYAKAHNEGLQIGSIQSVKSFTRKLNYRDEVSAPGARSPRYVSTQVGESTVKAHTRRINQKIPKRQFMGDSPYLRQDVKRVAAAEFLKEIRYLKA